MILPIKYKITLTWIVDNFCVIQFKPFWLPQLPGTDEQARSSSKKNIARVISVILANKYGTTSASPK